MLALALFRCGRRRSDLEVVEGRICSAGAFMSARLAAAGIANGEPPALHKDRRFHFRHRVPSAFPNPAIVISLALHWKHQTFKTTKAPV